MSILSQIMIVVGVFGIALRVDGHLQGEPSWLYWLLRIVTIIVLLGGQHLFGLALKREILEEVRKKHDDAA